MANILRTNRNRLVLGISATISLFSSAAAAATDNIDATPAVLCDPASIAIFKFEKTDDSKPTQKLEAGVLTCKPKADLGERFVGTAIFYPAQIPKSKQAAAKEQSTIIEQTIRHGSFSSADTRIMFLPNDTSDYQCKVVDIDQPYKPSISETGKPLDLGEYRTDHFSCDGLIKRAEQLHAAEVKSAIEVRSAIIANYEKTMRAYEPIEPADTFDISQRMWPYKGEFVHLPIKLESTLPFNLPQAAWNSKVNIEQPKTGNATVNSPDRAQLLSGIKVDRPQTAEPAVATTAERPARFSELSDEVTEEFFSKDRLYNIPQPR